MKIILFRFFIIEIRLFLNVLEIVFFLIMKFMLNFLSLMIDNFKIEEIGFKIVMIEVQFIVGLILLILEVFDLIVFLDILDLLYLRSFLLMKSSIL